jgi:hypothetical protein
MEERPFTAKEIAKDIIGFVLLIAIWIMVVVFVFTAGPDINIAN